MGIIVNLILIYFIFLFMLVLVLVGLCAVLVASLRSFCWFLLEFCGRMAGLMYFLWGWAVGVEVFSSGCVCLGRAFRIFVFSLGLILGVFCIFCLRSLYLSLLYLLC